MPDPAHEEAKTLLQRLIACDTSNPPGREAQAAAILEESDEREDDRVDPPGQGVEHRRSQDTVELPVIDADAQDEPNP